MQKYKNCAIIDDLKSINSFPALLKPVDYGRKTCAQKEVQHFSRFIALTFWWRTVQADEKTAVEY